MPEKNKHTLKNAHLYICDKFNDSFSYERNEQTVNYLKGGSFCFRIFLLSLNSNLIFNNFYIFDKKQ